MSDSCDGTKTPPDSRLPAFRLELGARELRAWLGLMAPVVGYSRGRRRRSLGAVRVRVDRNGWRVIALTSDATAAVDATLAREACDSYEFRVSGELTVDAEKLAQIAKLARRGELIRLEMDPEIGAVLRATVGRLVRTCGLGRDGDVSTVRELPTQQGEATARATVDGTGWAAALKNAASYADHITLATDGATVTVGATGEVESTEGPVDAALVEGSARAMYPLDAMLPIGAVIARAESIRIAWGTDQALRLAVAYSAGLTATYLQAPRVEEEESAPAVPEAAPEPAGGDAYPAEIVELADQEDPPVEAPASAPEPVPEPVVAHASPEIVEAFRLAPLVEAGLVVGTPAGSGGAPDCIVCRGWGRVYSRRADYPCPGCGGTQWADRPEGGTPTLADRRDSCVESVIRGYRLAHGRDAA